MRLTLTNHTEALDVVIFNNEVTQNLQRNKVELSSLIANVRGH